MSSSTSDHDAAQLRPSQGGDDVGALRLHQVLHHQEAEEAHVCLHLSAAERRTSHKKGFQVENKVDEKNMKVPKISI